MRKELNYQDTYKKYSKFSIKKLQELIQDMQSEMDKSGGRVTSESFKILNDSSNNLKCSVINQLLDEKSSSN